MLAFSFCVDGWVLLKCMDIIRKRKPAKQSLYQYMKNIKDPFIMAVLCEDSAACVGVLIAAAGIGASHLTGNPMWDSVASIGIGGLLGVLALYLVKLNKNFLLGQSVDPEIENAIKELLLKRDAIDAVYAVQTQYVGPSTFSYKAEVDFDGTFLAAQLHSSYNDEFMNSPNLEDDLPLLLAWYAEDVTRMVEKEVKEVEKVIRVRREEVSFLSPLFEFHGQ